MKATTMTAGIESSGVGIPVAISLDNTRIARCPACGHEGPVSRDLPTSQKLRCRVCGESALVRACIGSSPCRHRKPSRATAAKAAAVREVLARIGDTDLNDRVDNLWNAG